jgi:hypothetical protein
MKPEKKTKTSTQKLFDSRPRVLVMREHPRPLGVPTVFLGKGTNTTKDFHGPIIEADSLTRTFGSIKALDGISTNLHRTKERRFFMQP